MDDLISNDLIQRGKAIGTWSLERIYARWILAPVE